jgi:hypothetical protein
MSLAKRASSENMEDLGFTLREGGSCLRAPEPGLSPPTLLLLLLTALPRGHHMEVAGFAGKADSQIAIPWFY